MKKIRNYIEAMTQQVNNEKTGFVSYFQEAMETEPIEVVNTSVEPEVNSCEPASERVEMAVMSVEKTIAHANPTTQILLAGQLNIHLPEAGLNPLVDAAAHLFSIMGKLRHLKSNHNLSKLHADLKHEIENFREVIQAYSYNANYISEYIPITCYALCVSLDDIIANTSWGSQGKWDDYNLVATFIPDPPSHLSFFLILERLIMDPAAYIDLMEFMYLCLSLGFKCGYSPSTTEFNNDQIEQVINSLYKRIQAYRRNFNRALSPYPIRPAVVARKFSLKNLPQWLIIMLVSSLSIMVFSGSIYLLKAFFK